MVFQKILPKHGGGGIRRFFRIRQDLFNHYMNPISIAGSSSTKTMLQQPQQQQQQQQQQNSQAMEDYSHKYMKPLSIYDFKRKDDIADVLQTLNNNGGGSNNTSKSNNNHNHNNNNNEKTMMMKMMKGGWRLSDDEVIQGYSRGTIDLINYHNTSNIDGNDDDEKNKIKQPFIRWTGNIDTRIGTKSRAKRSGFCAIRCPEVPFGIPLSKYNALEINCRTDGRIYTVNLKVSSYFPDDLYQALITVDMSHNNNNSNSEGDFLTLVLPFEDFVLTSSGLVRDTQRYLDGGVHLEHLGFTIMDGQDGPFQFDLARIRAVNYRDGIIVGDDDRQSTRRSSGNGNK